MLGEFVMRNVGMSGEEHIVPLATAVASTENEENWTWFLEYLLKAISGVDYPDVFNSSDRDKGLLVAQQNVLPKAHSSYCALHLSANVNVNFKATIKSHIFSAARATTVGAFEEAMDLIKKHKVNGPKAYDCLMTCKENWANVHFPIPRYSVLTSNTAECFNSTISEERKGSYLYVFTSFSLKFGINYYSNHVRLQKVEYDIPLQLNNKREVSCGGRNHNIPRGY